MHPESCSPATPSTGLKGTDSSPQPASSANPRPSKNPLKHVLPLLAFAAILRAEPMLPWGDQGDGTYRNPILPADYSDPDVIRVGADFYLVASDFHFMGMQVLHSRDLVNWRIIGQVFARLGFHAKYDQMLAYGQGTWAPSLRYHNGTYYLYVCTPRDGLLRYTATNPAGPWSGGLIHPVARWEDPCPFWDDDGQAWLVHSQLGAGPLILHKMSPDGTRLLDDGVEIYRGPVAEGPKLFKRNGWYYISLPEGGVEHGGQTVLRAAQITGPYERRVVLPDGSPHQGGLVELDNGEAWFIGFRSAGHLGRLPHLQPVKWVDDWPVFGNAGWPVLAGRKPTVGAGTPILHPQTSDSFDAPDLAPQWQWNHNPVTAAWSLAERPGWLRLKALPADDLEHARNTLTQKIWGWSGSFEVKLDAAGLASGQRAGLAFMSGRVFNPVGAERTPGGLRLFHGAGAGPAVEGSALWLRGSYLGDRARLSYSLDHRIFHDVGDELTLKFGHWKGARVALFSYGSEAGAADFDDFAFAPGPDAVPLLLPSAATSETPAPATR